MKRFQNKSFAGNSFTVLPNTLQCVSIASRKVWFYMQAKPQAFRNLIMTRVDEVDLPLLDMYEVKANSKEGIIVGYAFDTNAKVIRHTPNFLLACNTEFPASKIGHLNKKCFGMKYRYNGVFLYEYEGMASMVTTGLSQSMQESLELT